MKDIDTAKYLKLFAVVLALAFLPIADAEVTNVSILYGWNGTNFVPVQVTSGGAIKTDINITQSSGLVPKLNNTYDLGQTAYLWANLYVRSIRGGSGPLSLFAGESERLTLLAGGNVGIRTSSPGAGLEVSGTSGSNNLSLNVNNTLYVNTSIAGRVGIGTASPTAALDVAGNITAQGYVGNAENLTNLPYINVSINYGYNTTNFVPLLTTSSGVLQLVVDEAVSNNASNLVAGANGTSLFLTQNLTVLKNLSVGTTTLFVDQTAGNVGIGIATPGHTLHVVGSANVTQTLFVEGINLSARQISDNGTQGSLITGNNNTLTAVAGQKANQTEFANTNTTIYGILGQKLNLTGGTLSNLLTIANSSTANNLSFNASGVLYTNQSGDTRYVGIGISSPNQLVQIAGGHINLSSGNLWVTGAIIINGTPVGSGTAAGWSENAASIIVYNNTANVGVGIGTATPNAKFTILGSNITTNLSLNVNNTLYVNASLDRVGIGTTAPAGTLHVAGLNDVRALTVAGGSVTGSGTTGTELHTGTVDTTGTNINSYLWQMTKTAVGSGWRLFAFEETVSGNRFDFDGSNVLRFVQRNTATYNYMLIGNGIAAGDSGLEIAHAPSGYAGPYLTNGPTSVVQSILNANNGRLVFGTSNTFAGLIDTSQRWGIGTTAPTSTLHVAGTSNITGGLNVTTGGLRIISGNVGIGTTAPQNALHVLGDANFTGNLYLNGSLIFGDGGSGGGGTAGNVSGGGAENYVPRFGTSSNLIGSNIYDNGNIGLGTGSPSAKLHVVGTNTANNLSLHVNGTLYINTSVAARVGINTATPGSTLEVVGTANITGGLNVSAGGFYVLGGNVGIGTGAPAAKLEVSGANNLVNNLSFNANNTLYVNGSIGRVGINITNPTSSLHVSGDANITGAYYGPYGIVKGYPAILNNASNTVSQVAIVNFTVPANDMQDGDIIIVEIAALFKSSGVSGGVSAWQWNLSYGDKSVIYYNTTVTHGDDASEKNRMIRLVSFQRVGNDIWVMGNGATTSTADFMSVTVGTDQTTTSSPAITPTFTSDQTVSILVKLDEALAGYYLKPQHARVWKIGRPS